MATYPPANFDSNLEHIVTVILNLPLTHPLALALSQSFVNTFDDFRTIDIEDVVHDFRYNMTSVPLTTPGIKLHVNVVKRIQRMVSYARYKEENSHADCDTPLSWDTDVYSKWCRNGYATYLTSLIPITSSTFGLLGIATVDDGEVIPVENTPPPPEPEKISVVQQTGSVHNDEYDLISSTTTVRRTQTQSHTVTCLEPSLVSTTTVQCPVSTSINGEKYTSQSKYKDDFTDNDTITKDRINLMVVPYQEVTVNNGEVILVENTPPHPPPRPEPPPSIINNNNGYEYSVTSIDGEWTMLFRAAYQVDRMYRIVRRPLSSTSIDGEWTMLF
jgi:hypothetical protein